MSDRDYQPDMDREANKLHKYLEKNLISKGMDVVGNNWKYIGWIREVREKEVLVDRKGTEILFIPLEAVEIEKETVKIHVPGEEVEKQGWRIEKVKSNR